MQLLLPLSVMVVGKIQKEGQVIVLIELEIKNRNENQGVRIMEPTETIMIGIPEMLFKSADKGDLCLECQNTEQNLNILQNR